MGTFTKNCQIYTQYFLKKYTILTKKLIPFGYPDQKSVADGRTERWKAPIFELNGGKKEEII